MKKKNYSSPTANIENIFAEDILAVSLNVSDEYNGGSDDNILHW